MEIEEGEIEIESQPETPTPIFEILFGNIDDYEKYNKHITNIFKQHWDSTITGKELEISIKMPLKEENSHNQPILQAFEKIANNIVEIETKSNQLEEDLNSDQNSSDSQDFGVALNNLFQIDPSPSTSLESAKVPSYKRAMKEFLDEESKSKCSKIDEDICVRPKPSSSCFNCGDQGHGLRDCPEPKNMKRINRAKKAHSLKGERYHADSDQRFAHLRPGKISDKLQKAIRLRQGELPSFFYRMRVCGYPPGWLEEAKVAHSGLAMFNSGDDFKTSEENVSESDDEIKYDISKIIEFPGFNISPGSSFYDDYKYHNVPPMNQRYMKNEMIIALGNSAIKGFKLKKLKDNITTSLVESNNDVSIANIEDHDMEIEDATTLNMENVEFTRPLPPPLPPTIEDSEELPPLPPERKSPSPPSCSSPALDSSIERTASPTLDELQAAQRALLLKLENGDDSHELDDTTLTEIYENCNSNIIPPQNLDQIPTPDTPTTPLPIDHHELKKIIKSSHMGTPVLKFSPFEKLPSGDNFKVGVSDVINFENLPDSTGKYESMKDVIKKVRTIKKRLNAEDE